MKSESVIIVSNFLDKVREKYPHLIQTYYLSSAGKELVLIKISCQIDELKDIFQLIRPARIIKDGVNIAYYCNNINRDCHTIQRLFREVGYDFVIEIYNNDFESFDKNIFSIVNLDEIDFFGNIDII